MAATQSPKDSIAELEQEIAKLSAALDSARAQEFAAAEHAVTTENKALSRAEKKVADLEAKENRTPAAEAHLRQAKTDLTTQADATANARAVLAALTSAQSADKKIAKKIAKKLKRKTKKAEKTAKAARKAAGKLVASKVENAEVKTGALENISIELKTAVPTKTAAPKAKITKAKPTAIPGNIQPAVVAAEQSVTKIVATEKPAKKKAPVRKAPVKKEPAKTAVVTTIVAEAPVIVETPLILASPIVAEALTNDANVAEPAALPFDDDKGALS